MILAAVLQSYSVLVCFGKEPLAARTGRAAKGSDSTKARSASNDAHSARNNAHSTSKKGGLAEPGWSLKQRSQYDGNLNLSITKKAIKIDGERLDYRLLLRAPQWRVLIISDRSRKMNEVSADKWESPFGQTFQALNRIRFDNATLVDKGRKQFQSVSCRKFGVMPPKEALKRENERYRGAVVNDAVFLVCDKLGAPAQASTFLCKRFGLPTAPGVPISFVCA